MLQEQVSRSTSATLAASGELSLRQESELQSRGKEVPRSLDSPVPAPLNPPQGVHCGGRSARRGLAPRRGGFRCLIPPYTNANAKQECLEVGLSSLHPRLLAALGPDAPRKTAKERGRKGKNVHHKHSVK